MTEHGKDLFKAFRPSYIRAFKDAADYAKDDGVTIKGTKNATQDDFVSKEEFKYFCIYVLIYAAMFDAFAKIDGGGAGRDAHDDKRLELHEWLEGFKSVSKHGFVALKSIADKKEAEKLFKEIDDNGGGIVLLDEWCFWLKQGEVRAGTEVGQLLGADEAGGVGKAEKLVAGKAQVLGQHAADAAAEAPAGSKPPAGGKKGGSGPSGAALKKEHRSKSANDVVGGKSGAHGPARGGSGNPWAAWSEFVPTVPGEANAFGLTVGKGKSGATKDFFDFAACFEPFCVETPEAEKLRELGFLEADPNGNGLCSLSECETFVLKRLVAKFPRQGIFF